MRHVCQDFTLAPVRQLSRLPRRHILLNAIPQVEHHLVDLCLQGIHLAASLDRDEPCEIAIHDRSRDLCEASDLSRQVSCHGVDGKAG